MLACAAIYLLSLGVRWAVTAVVFTLVSLAFLWSSVIETVSYSRFSLLLEHSELRVILFEIWLDFVLNDWICLIFGCGFFAIDTYTNGRIGYPHNIFLELISTIGMPMSLAIIFFLARGIFTSFRLNLFLFSPVPIIFLYYLLIGQKSVSLSDNWLAVSSLTFFVLLGFNSRLTESVLKKSAKFEELRRSLAR